MTIYYLYIKYCSHCDLKYLGQTKQKDPFVYKGSGTRWKKHLKKHNASIHTEVIGIYDDKKLLSEAGIFFSKLYNVVEDAGWANLKEERGDGGTFVLTPEFRAKVAARAQDPGWRAKIAANNRKKAQDPEYRAKLSAAHKNKPKSMEHRAKMSAANRKKAQDPEFRAKVSATLKKRFEDPELRAKASAKMSAEFHARLPRTCPHCGFASKNYSNLTQHHFDRCKKRSVLATAEESFLTTVAVAISPEPIAWLS